MTTRSSVRVLTEQLEEEEEAGCSGLLVLLLLLLRSSSNRSISRPSRMLHSGSQVFHLERNETLKQSARGKVVVTGD